jgi:hypothetical protein
MRRRALVIQDTISPVGGQLVSTRLDPHRRITLSDATLAPVQGRVACTNRAQAWLRLAAYSTRRPEPMWKLGSAFAAALQASFERTFEEDGRIPTAASPGRSASVVTSTNRKRWDRYR